MLCVRLSPDRRYDPPKAVVHRNTCHHARNRRLDRSEWKCGFDSREDAADWTRTRTFNGAHYGKPRRCKVCHP